MYRRTCAFAIVWLFAMPILAADNPTTSSRVSAPTLPHTTLGLTTSLWSWLKEMWPLEGCRVEPSGGCAPSLGQVGPFRGVGTHQSVRPEQSCSLDPNGLCIP